jgi:hypothetical protein
MTAPGVYVDFLAREYLDGFIAEGGAAVKFAVPLDGATTYDLNTALHRTAVEADYVFAEVDAARTRVHMIDQVFFELARQVDWDALARQVAGVLVRELGFPVSEHAPTLDIDGIARTNDYAPAELRRDFNRELQEQVGKDYALAREFRIAMIRLCQASVDPGGVAQTTRAAVLEWLTGELRRISVLKPALIYQRITRANARHMLVSLARWVRRGGRRGLVVFLDARQLAVTRRADAGDGVYYTKPMVLDAYEVLRQLVDGTDELEACLVCTGCPEEFLENNYGRGLAAYQALHMRVYDEVRDRHRVNPLAALVRLSGAGAATSAS